MHTIYDIETLALSVEQLQYKNYMFYVQRWHAMSHLMMHYLEITALIKCTT